ncbi:hypothetical protein AcV7_005399 [Taiwanofungus camphoratus]|nr:hypothetical protein AcV7_005399 [Antrodia cinnamomea]
MNTSPPQTHATPAAPHGINPALLAALQSQGQGANANAGQFSQAQLQQLYAARQAQGQGGGQGAMNPAAIMRFQQQRQALQGGNQQGQGGGAVSPAQLLSQHHSSGGGGMGGGNMMNMGMGGVNSMSGMGMGNMGGMGINGVNPMNMMNMGMGGGMNGMGGMNMNGMNGMMGGINPAALMGGSSTNNNNAGTNSSGQNGPGSPSSHHLTQGLPPSASHPPSPAGSSTNLGNMASAGHASQGLSASSSHSQNQSQNAQNHGGNQNPGFPQLAPGQLAHLAGLPPHERERQMQQIRMMQMQRMMMAQNMQGMQGMGGNMSHNMQNIQNIQNMMGGMQNMGQGQGQGQVSHGMQGMSTMNPQAIQNMNMNANAQAMGMALPQLMQQQQQQQQFGGYERPSSAASTGSHRDHRMSVPPQGLAPHPSQNANVGQNQGQQSSGQIQHPYQTQNQAQSQNQGGLQHNQGQNQNSMMPPPSIPPRPSTAHSPRPPSGSYGFSASSPRPSTSGGPSASPHVPSGGMSLPPQPQSQSQAPSQGQGMNSMPVPIQPRPSTPRTMQRPGTSMAMQEQMGQGQAQQQGQQQNAPSRPATAAGYQQQQQQQNGFLGMPNGQQQAKSTGYPPIAPAPAQPGSPRGAKRKVGGTPAPQLPQQHLQQNQQSRAAGGPLPMPPIPHISSVANANGSGTGLSGMGITGNVGPQGQGQMPSAGMSVGVGLLGGAGGGMMGPPVLPRAASQQPHDMGMTMTGLPGQAPAISRHVSGGPMGGQPMNVNASLNFMGAPPQSTPTPIPHIGLSQANSSGALARSPSSQGQVVDLATAARAMASLTGGGIGLGLGASSMHGMSGVGGMGMDIPVPQTPHQHAHQHSQPPVAPFPHVSSPTASTSGMLGAPVGLRQRADSVSEKKMPVLPGAVPNQRGPSSVGGEAAQASSSSSAQSSVLAPAPIPNVIPHLPPLPANVSLNPKVTRVSVVPLAESTTLIPPLTQDEIADIKTWMKTDKEYEAVYKRMRERMGEEVRETISAPRAWYERDPTEEGRNTRRRTEKFSLTGVKTGKEGRERRKTGRREGFKLPRKVAPEDANRPEQLVPIRLEFDVEHHKMRDTFVWNLNDPVITPEIFAQTIVDDYSLAPSYHSVITKAIQDQLSDFKAHSTTFGEDGEVNALVDSDVILKGTLEEGDVAWWEAWRTKVRSNTFHRESGKAADNRSRKRRKIVKEEVDDRSDLSAIPESDRPMSVDDFEEHDSMAHEEMRILIKLDIIVGSVKLEDQFEWDLENTDPSPERFAEVYAKELGLGGEFKTAIAHSIREQVQIFQKSLFLVGHPSDGSAVQDDDLRMSLLPSLTTAARSMDQVGAFTPLLNYLSESEIERNEKEREKELNRRRRKTTRGRRGIALPDREPPKTFRTPAIGFPEVDAATLALVNAAAAPTSRRAAAAAASVTIANMVASENGTVVLPSSSTASLTPITPSAPKEKKPKGLFKAPSYPPSVLRPRAHVKAPTESTAADISTLPPPVEGDEPIPNSSAAPDSKGAMVVLPIKRVKELEKEAKEKEYADGQHANLIDGVWHCSNCGCPESIAVGRRKGPLGDKSQCGTCGKFWHRHRRPRPVVYNSDAEYHMSQKKEAEQAKVAAKRKRPPPAAAEEQASKEAADDGDVEPETPSQTKTEVWVEVPPLTQTSTQPDGAEGAVSPVSSASSTSESPLAQRVLRANGTGHARSAPPTSIQEADPGPINGTISPPAASPPPSRPSAPPNGQQRTTSMPDWLKQAMVAMQERYPTDKFELLLRRRTSTATPEWRIKCLDCPGKLYTPGPGESLSNYEVHLRNRHHRHRVNSRLAGVPA